MEYENTHEATRQAACENVKKIVNAIKAIRIKYYPNFARISEEDKKTFEELNQNLEIITSENNLGNLKVALMGEVSAKYERKEEEGNPKTEDDILLACYGAIDVEQKALAAGKLKQAKKCQEILNQYLKEIDSPNYRGLIINYKREKFGELVATQKLVQDRIETWNNALKALYQPEDSKNREELTEKILDLKEKANKNVMPKEEKENTEELALDN